MAFFEGSKMTAGYGNGPDIISSCSINANRGEIVAILGPNGAGRITDQSLNMDVQQSQVDAVMKSISGIKWFTDTRDRLIKFYGDGKVAVASFYWHRTFVLPPNTNSEKRNIMKKQPDPAAISLVLEKKKGVWKIVHTHTSSLVNKSGD